MNKSPLVSVIVPVYNGDKYLASALDSIVAQTYRPLEIIVVDDGSVDRSAEIAQAYALVRYAFQEHAGLGAALNHGVWLARAEYLSFLDADDLWHANKLELQMLCLEQDPLLDMVFAHVQEFRQNALTSTEPLSKPIEGYFKGTLLVRREAFFRVGLFDTRYRVGDFVDWYMRSTEIKLKSKMLSNILLKRRLHGENMGIRERDQRHALLQILRQSLNRRQQNL